MKKLVVIAVVALLAGCAGMGGGAHDYDSNPHHTGVTF